MPALKLCLMGHFQLTLREQPLGAFRSQRTRALLAYLVVEHARPLQRTHLAHLFWASYDPDAARTNLRVSLSNIRQILSPFDLVHATYHTVQFDVRGADFWCDVLALEAAVAAPQLGESPWSGSEDGPPYEREFLEGLDAIDSPPFQVWLKEQRTRYRRLLGRLGQKSDQALLAPLLKGALPRVVGPPAVSSQPQPNESSGPRDGKMGAVSNVPSDMGATAAPVSLNQAPEVAFFHGREHELKRLGEWLRDTRCRLIMILGMGGQGKTALAARCANSAVMQGQDGQPDGERTFSHILWRSLVNAPPLVEVLESWLKPFSGQAESPLEGGVDQRLDQLFFYLQQHRCLLVLDNLESILSAGERAGYFRAGYEEYSYFLEQFAMRPHRSSLLLTSREEPQRLKVVALGSEAVQSLRLGGLSLEAGRALLQGLDLAGEPAQYRPLVERYSGNPLALKLVAATISDLFGGQIAQFLATDSLFFDDIRDILDQHFARLSPVEVAVLHWLAVEREPIPFEGLCDDLVQFAPRRAIIEAVRSLQRRLLIEHSSDHCGLQNVILEYTTDRLVERVCQMVDQGATEAIELLLQSPLNGFALVKAQAKEYVRQSQERLLLRPVATWLTTRWGKARFAEQAQRILRRLQQEAPLAPGYTGANLLHLLLYLGVDLRGWDFSRLALWQANLRGITLQNVSLCNADLSRSLFMQPFETAYSLSFSPDGQLLATGTDNGEIHVWRLAEQQVEWIFAGHTGQVWSVAFSPAGNLLASGAEDQTVRLWDIRSGEGLHILRGLTTSVKVVSFNATGEWLLGADENGVVHWWDIRTGGRAMIHGQPSTTFALNINYIQTAATTCDGRLLAHGGGDRLVYVRDAQSGQLKAKLAGHTDTIADLAFSADGRLLASSSTDQTIRLWSIDSEGRATSYSQLRYDRVSSATLFVRLAFSPDGAILAACLANGIYLWAVEPGSITRLLQHLSGSASKSTRLAFTPDGNTVVSANYDQTIRFWDARSGHATRTWFGRAESLVLVTYSPDGATLACSYFDRTVHVWDRTGNHLHRLSGHQDPVRAIAYSPDGATLATASDDRTVRLWDVVSGRLIHTLRGHTNLVRTLVFHPRGALMVSGGYDHIVQVWEVGAGQHRRPLEGHTGPIIHLAVSPDGALLATASEDQSIGLWEMHTGQLRLMLSGHTDFVRWVAFNPDGTLLASCSNDKTIKLWDVTRGQLLQTLEGHTALVHAVLCGCDGATLVSGGADQTVRIWGRDPVGGHWELRHTLAGGIYKYSCIALSPDGLTLVVGGMDMCVRLWDVRTGQLRRKLAGHSNLVTAVEFSPDGCNVVSSSSDGAVRIWDLQTGQCLQVLRPEGPYAGMNITGVTGISEAQKAAIIALGAVESD